MKNLLIILTLVLIPVLNLFGQPGAALNFDGVDDFIIIPHNSLLKPSIAITIEAWIKPANIHTNTYYEIYRKEDGNARHLFSFQEHGTILSFGLGIAGVYDELDANIIPSDYENQWVHVAATYDGTAKKIYRNGILIKTQNITGSIGTSGMAPAVIGSLSGTDEFFNGSIDELSLWNRSLSQCEIQTNMNCELNPTNQNGLIALYHFNQGIVGSANGSVVTLLDAGPNNLVGTLNNFALQGAASNWSNSIITPGVSCSGPSLSISVIEGSNPSCFGNKISFLASSNNIGLNTTYRWSRNTDISFKDTTSAYSGNFFENDDTIRCVATNSCNLTITSNAIILKINPSGNATVKLLSNLYNSLCNGDTANFSAFITKNLLSAPVYQWSKNNIDINGANSPYYSAVNINDGDIIKCKVICNSGGCLLQDTIISDEETVSVAPVYKFIGNGNWDISSNWKDSKIPPVLLPKCASIIIDPSAEGESILNTQQLVSSKASFIIMPGKKFTIQGALMIDSNSSVPIITTDFLDTSARGYGLVKATEAERINIPYVERSDNSNVPLFQKPANLPLSQSLEMPPPGDQKLINNCVGWVVGYGLLSYIDNILERNLKPDGSKDFDRTDKTVSPSFIYNQLNGGQNVGISIADALKLIKDKGCCKRSDMPDYGITEKPSTTATLNADAYKSTNFGFQKFGTIDIDLIKSLLISPGFPIPFGCIIDRSFHTGDGINIINRDGNRKVWLDYSDNDLEKHGMLICGYDDKINAFKVLNSWGPTKANNGYYWIDYSFFKKMVLKDYILDIFPSNPEIYFAYTSRAYVTINTEKATEITSATAKVGGNILNTSGIPIYERGICYSENINPTTACVLNTNFTIAYGGTDDAFIINITTLKENTKYYFRAYAKTSQGIVYGSMESFTTLAQSEVQDGIFIDPRDGQAYPFKQIGTQVWMVKNLNYNADGSHCYNEDGANCEIYGRLYDWNTALIVAPPGWHLPSDAEWEILINYLGGSAVAGGKMKEAGLIHWWSPNTGADNSSGFTGLPGGFNRFHDNTGFTGLGNSGIFWSSTDDPAASSVPVSWYRNLRIGFSNVDRWYEYQTSILSVRCIRDR